MLHAWRVYPFSLSHTRQAPHFTSCRTEAEIRSSGEKTSEAKEGNFFAVCVGIDEKAAAHFVRVTKYSPQIVSFSLSALL